MKKAPANLTAKARRLWREILTTYELAAHELLILEDACREVALIERLEAEIAELPTLTVRGSMKQPVVSELVKEIRQHRESFVRLMKALQLPEPDETKAAGDRSSQARAAAAARWAS